MSRMFKCDGCHESFDGWPFIVPGMAISVGDADYCKPCGIKDKYRKLFAIACKDLGKNWAIRHLSPPDVGSFTERDS